MPVYEFVCLACEEHFDRLLPMSAEEPPCPRCGDERTRRQLSLIAGLSGSVETAASGRASSSGCACGGACACGR